jgi:UDP-2,4-diacetamido-2,4,6-trideoxy-beta-L-altropyranose hydrolase
MLVAIRTDASIELGNGHVMRCLTLAVELRRHGANCVFICRPHQGNLINKIKQSGFGVVALPQSNYQHSELKNHNPQLGATWEIDVMQTLAALPEKVDWLVVDHYSIGAEWESRARGACSRLMVIDDLASRPHDCDLLLDQNPGRKREDYIDLVSLNCEILAGPTYALLRSEFALHRARSLSRNRNDLREILICMGGVDKDNISSEVLTSLASCTANQNAKITVVIGPHSPWIAEIKEVASRMPLPTRVLEDVDNMADLMAQSDLAIGAGGVSALERCCMGLPSIIIPIAENQRVGANSLAADHRVLLASTAPPGAPLISDNMLAFLKGGALEKLSAACASITDGHGSVSVATAMIKQIQAQLRPMEEHDLALVLKWRNTPSIREHMLNSHDITPNDHLAWFRSAGMDPDRQLLIAEWMGCPIGFVQFSGLREKLQSEWGFYAAPNAPKGSGTLLGRLALRHAFDNLMLPKLRGRVLPENIASINFHLKLGFRPKATNDELASCEPLLSFELLREEWKNVQGANL